MNDGYRIDNGPRALAWACISSHALHRHSRYGIITGGAWDVNRLLVHLNLRNGLLDGRVLLGAYIDVTVINGEEFVFRVHSRDARLFFEKANLAFIGART